jgi:hypothetical protein
MAQKPLKKIVIEKKQTKYFKRSEKDKSLSFQKTKEINKKILGIAKEKVERKKKPKKK